MASQPRTHLRLVGREPADAGHAVEADFASDSDVDPDAGIGVVDEEAEAPVEPAPNPLSIRFAVIALTAFQMLVALRYVGRYATLARGGDEYLVAAVLSLPASLCLYVGALLLALRPGRGRVLFIVAAVGFGLSVPAWGLSASWSWPIAFGAMLGLAGAWVARAEVAADEHSAAQP